MQAVIMAGGEGTRLRPLTCNLPKPMVPILNAPMMEHIVNLLKRHQYTNIACTLWYLPQEVTDYFQDGRDFGVKMTYFIETTPLGTAGSVKGASTDFQDTFLVVSGDALTDINLSSAVEFHKANKSMATLVLTRVPNPLSYGVVLIDKRGKITQFLEKPSWSQVFSDTVNTGIYILEPEVLEFIAPDQQVDFSRDVFPELLKRGAPLYGYVAEGYWSDVGSLPAYRQALLDSLDGKVLLDLPQKRTGQIYMEEGVELSPSVKLQGPVFLSKGCKIGANSSIGPYTVVGPNCHIGTDASLKHSILWSNVHVGNYSQLRGTICAKNVRLEQQIGAYEGSVLGEKVQIGPMTTINPDIKVWPHKKISSGTTLNRSVVWGSQERAGLFAREGIKGDYRGDLTPETIVEVGLSFASYYGVGKDVLITSDFTQLGNLAKEALIVGLRSGGVNVYDGGAVTGLLTRFLIQKVGLAGALHCKTDRLNQDVVKISCWDKRGHPLSKAEERKIENILLREDFARLDQERFGTRADVPDLTETYLDNLAKLYPAGDQGYKVGLMASEKSELGLMVENFLNLAGYSVQTINLDGLPTIVIEQESWSLRDEQGNFVPEDVWWQIFVQDLGLKGGKEAAVPVNRSQLVARAAEDAGVKVRWTKQELGHWMEVATELGNSVQSVGAELFPPIEPLASIGGVLNYLSSHNVSLSEYGGQFVQKQQNVLCPWENKGRVMRKLIENSNPEQTLYLDGIREEADSGWALVIPDGDEPIFSIQTESASEMEAARLLEHYVGLVKSYENEER